jgi:hypothetical protein
MVAASWRPFVVFERIRSVVLVVVVVEPEEVVEVVKAVVL